MTMGMTVQAVDAQSPTNCAPWVCIQEAPLVAPGVTSPAVPATFSVPLSSPVHRSRFGLIPCGTGRNSELKVHRFFEFQQGNACTHISQKNDSGTWNLPKHKTSSRAQKLFTHPQRKVSTLLCTKLTNTPNIFTYPSLSFLHLHS